MRALAHHHQPVGELERLLLVVGDEHRGVAGAVVDLAQPLAQLLAHLRVERAERLVEQQHPRLDGERPGQRHALPLAARELLRIALVEAGELHQIEQLQRPAADLGAGRTGGARPHLEPEGDVLEDGHVAEQRIGLEHEADIALLHRLGRGVLVAEEDAARGGGLEPGDEPQQRGLARARGPEQRDQLARADVERHVVERRVAREFLADVLDADIQRRAPSVPAACAASSSPKRNSRTVLNDAASPAPAWPAARRRRRRRRNCTRCRGFRCRAAWSWSCRGYGRRPPTPRRTRPWRGRCRAARRRAGPT